MHHDNIYLYNMSWKPHAQTHYSMAPVMATLVAPWHILEVPRSEIYNKAGAVGWRIASAEPALLILAT